MLFINFYRDVMQTRHSDENSVHPSVRLSVWFSVCLSVTRVNRDKTEERSAKIFYTIRKIIYPSLLRRRMVGGGDPFYLKF